MIFATLVSKPLLLALIVISSAFFTSALSGLVGMAGGMLLMFILISIMPVASAMIFHAITQISANGSRAWLLREHLVWRLLPPYLIGAGMAATLGAMIAFVPEPGMVLVLIGLFPWLARCSQSIAGLNIMHPPTAMLCGFIVTSAQLTAGASGPVLDMFYLQSGLGREAVVANKSLTQTIGHGLRILYYGVLIDISYELSPWLLGATVLAALLGTRLGTWLLRRWNDAQFQRITSKIILTIATISLLQGLRLLFI